MSEGSFNSVVINIDCKLNALPSIPSKPSIFRVDRYLQGGSDNVYDPEILSVGPYHHGISRLEKMEQLKYRYLKQLLERRNEQSVDRYVTAVAAMEKRARACYAESLDLDEYSFVTLMVLDGIFLIELFRYFTFRNMKRKDDPIFTRTRILSQLRHDILLFENQLPLFVLDQLCIMTKTNSNLHDDLISLALPFFFFDGTSLELTRSVSEVREKLSRKHTDHLCALIHDAWCLPFAETISQGRISATKSWRNINSVSDLQETGIIFQTATGNNLMDIKFENSVLKVPQLRLYDNTEPKLRNLIAYEQYFPIRERRYISDYTFFLSCLINRAKDVELLRVCGVIENWLGNDDEACAMINRLGRNVVISSDFCYSQVFCGVNKHHGHRVKKWKANLYRNYFNSPWSILSFLAAIALLVLAFTQTAYSILAFHYKGNR